MKLVDFLKEFVDNNGIVRMLVKHHGGNICLADSWNVASMCHAVASGKCQNFSKFLDCEVLHVTSVLCHSVESARFPEAINIVLDKNDILTKTAITEEHLK